MASNNPGIHIATKTVNGMNWTYTISNGQATITSAEWNAFVKARSSLVIPEKLGNCPVTVIGPGVFVFHSEVLDVTIPSGIEEIWGHAFSECVRLKTVKLPASLKTLGSSVFDGCNELENVTLPNNVTSIGDSAFADCTSLREIAIPPCTRVIKSMTFAQCTGLSKVIIPEGVFQIEFEAFGECRLLQMLVIPKSVEIIEKGVFSGCNGLRKLYVSEALEKTSMLDKAGLPAECEILNGF